MFVELIVGAGLVVIRGIISDGFLLPLLDMFHWTIGLGISLEALSFL